jgi:chloride channel 3/4/5
VSHESCGQGNTCLLQTGAAIGVNAAFLNIITEWLSDVKLGYCKTAFYLNENFCCWGEDNGMNEDTEHGISC